MKKDIPFSQKPYSAPLVSLGAEVVNNFYVELATSETVKAKYYYVGIPGLELLQKSSSTLFSSSSACRGLHTTAANKTYGVYGKNLVEIVYSNGATSYNVVGELNTSTGIVRFADNTGTVLLVDGQYGYTIDTANNTFSQITDESFPGSQDGVNGPSFCACVDTMFIVNSSNTNKYYWSAPGYIPYAFDSTKPNIRTLWNA